MVKPVNTPIAYSATNTLTRAWVTKSSVIATAASTRIPLEKANRCPRRVSCRGKNWSPATKLAR